MQEEKEGVHGESGNMVNQKLFGIVPNDPYIGEISGSRRMERNILYLIPYSYDVNHRNSARTKQAFHIHLMLKNYWLVGISPTFARSEVG